MTAIITNKFKKREMQLLIDDIALANSNYFVFISKHTDWPSEVSPTTETTSLQDASIDLKLEMMAGKIVSNSGVTYMISKNDWASNTVYAFYDHRDDNLLSNTYFVINSSNNVYKCIYNNEDANSTVEPTSLSNSVFTLADGYVWKYMYHLSSANASKFADSSYIPFDEDQDVTNSAIDGAIHLIVVEDGGSGWTTTLEGFIQQVVSNTIFEVDGNNSISTNGFYTDSSVYIANGTGAGSLSKITNYFSNSTGKFITTQDTLSLDLTSGFQIAPTITITGDGSNAEAYCTVSSGIIDGVFMINEGLGYNIANVTASANSSYGSGENLVAIISPQGGHGADVPGELNCTNLGIFVEINGDESNTVSTEIDFRQAGIIYNPTAVGNTSPWSNTTFDQTLSFDVTTVSGFTDGEIVEGLSSEAKALIAFSNSSHAITTLVSGSFSNGETVIGEDSAISGVISNINTPEIEAQSGEIFFYTNVTKTQRSDTTTEVVKLILQF